MCIYRRIAGSSSQVLVLTVRNVLSGLGVPVLLRQTKVDEEKFITMASDSHQKVVRFDVCDSSNEIREN